MITRRLFLACFPYWRFNAPAPSIDQWFANPRITIEDQNSEISRDDRGPLTKGRDPLFFIPPLLREIGQRALFQPRDLAQSASAHGTPPLPFIFASSASILFTTSAISIARV
jgi:hypothetical protein